MFAHCQSRRRKQGWQRAGVLALVAALALAICPSPAWGQQLLKKSLVTPGDTKPIQIYADQISTWLEDGQRVFLLKGKVWIEQGLVSIRMAQGVVWIDEQGQQKTGVYPLEVYGEGNVFLEESAGRESSAGAFFQLATRGVVRITPSNGQASQVPQSEDPVFRRARHERALVRGQPAAADRPPAVDSFLRPASGTGEVIAPAGTGAVPPPAPAQVVPLAAWSPGQPRDGVVTAQAPVNAPPGPSSAQDPVLPPPAVLPGAPGAGAAWQLTIRPRSSQEIQARSFPQANGEAALVVSSGIILTVRHPNEPNKLLDIEADRMVLWAQGDSQEVLGNLRSPQGQAGGSRQLEFFLSGNVAIRTQNAKETILLRADEVYYDVARNVAVAIHGDLEVKQPKLIHPLHLQADELIQAGPKLFQAGRSEVYSTILPSDPGLKIIVSQSSLEERSAPKRTIFGVPYTDPQTGEARTQTQRLFRGRNMTLELEGLPVFYFPYIQGDPEDPLGPLEKAALNYNRVFGFQFFTSWNVYNLIGVDPVPGTRWLLDIDGMTRRGPALGTDFDFAGTDLFGIANKYQGLIKAWGIYDQGNDILGGNRGLSVPVAPGVTVPITHPDWRGWVNSKTNVQELPNGFTVQAQVSAISDRNFLEQFFGPTWTNDLNQETYLYVKQQGNHWAWTGLAEPNLRPWITQTQWLPRADGHLLGLTFFDLLTYNAQADAAFARLRTTNVPPFAYLPTDVSVDTGRFDFFNELSLPWDLGPCKVVPYLVGDMAYYTSDVSGADRGRLLGGGGVRGSVPFSRLYPEAQSDLFNVSGIFHKVMLSGNYLNVDSSSSLANFPQLDRLNDDASDQALRFIRPNQPALNPANAAFLTTSSLFDPQYYAWRRLVDNRIDSRDSMDVLQMGLRQRWQTKRGFPGQQHIIDWMTFDVQASMFPHSQRDHVGELFGIVEYDWVWNIGDQSALVSNGWFEPFDQGPRTFNITAVMNRPDRTSYTLGYRQIDPLRSRAVIGSMTYAFSPKYALTASSLYDFGVNNQVNSLMLTRIGTDLQLTLGFTYNSILNNFGVVFEVMPNIIPAGSRGGLMRGSNVMARQ